MFTPLRSRMTAYVVPATFVSVLGLFALGCNEDISENAIFTDQQALVLRIDEDTKDMSRQVDDVSQTLSRVTRQLEALQRDPIEDDRRTRELEREVMTLNKAVVGFRATIDELLGRIDSQQASIAVLTRRVSSVQAQSRSATDVRPTAASFTQAPSTSKSAADKPAYSRVRTRGSYLLVRVGQSLADIASLTGVSSDALRAANQIPPGREPLPGQQIYVPAGG